MSYQYLTTFWDQKLILLAFPYAGDHLDIDGSFIVPQYLIINSCMTRWTEELCLDWISPGQWFPCQFVTLSVTTIATFIRNNEKNLSKFVIVCKIDANRLFFELPLNHVYISTFQGFSLWVEGVEQFSFKGIMFRVRCAVAARMTWQSVIMTHPCHSTSRYSWLIYIKRLMSKWL